MRTVESVTPAAGLHWVGDGFPVHPMMSPDVHGQAMSPFLLLDYAAPMAFQPSEGPPRGVGEHPHRGFETVTIVYAGELEHRDSTGAGGGIGPGDVQWMTAGAGILHEEFHSAAFTRTGGTLEMAQLWINLPSRYKMSRPGYQTLFAKEIPSIALGDAAGTLRVIAGTFDGATGPAHTFSDIDLWDVALTAGGSTTLTLPEGHTAGIALLSGRISVNGSPPIHGPALTVLSREGFGIAVTALSAARFLVLSGEPIDEPIVARGPFVMNTDVEIRQAMLDYKSGRFGVIPD